MDAMQILVVILSIFLLIFLTLAIILISRLIKVSQQIADIAASAQDAIQKVSGLATTATKLVSPAVIMRLIMSQLKKFKAKKEK